MNRQRLQLRILAAGLIVFVCVATGVTLMPTQAKADESFEYIKAEKFEGIIVAREKAGEFMKGFSNIEERDTWTPNKSEVLELEDRLEGYLKKAAARRSPNLWSKLAKYKRQYVGLTRKGRKVIFANFFCDTFDIDWKTMPVSVEDGGDCFFGLFYDPAFDTFSDLQINGEA